MENPIFDELSFQIFENTQKSKIVFFFNFVHLFEKGVSQFEAKGWLFSSLEKLFFIFYFTKSRRDVQKRYIGVTRHGESDFRWIIFSNFWKHSKVENRIFLNFVHLFEKGVSQFEAKGWLFSSLKKLFFVFDFTKSRRDVQKRYIGVTRHGESDVRLIIFSKFWKSSIVENSKIQKIDTFSDKSHLDQKSLKIDVTP